MLVIPDCRMTDYTWYAQRIDTPLFLSQRISMPEAEDETEDYLPALFETASIPQYELFDPAIYDFPDTPGLRFFGTIWPDFRARLLASWDKIHPAIRSALLERSLSIRVVHDLNEYFGNLHSVIFTAGGCFIPSDNVMVIPQRMFWTPKLMVPLLGETSVLLHETAHALDYNLGTLSNRPGFRKAYETDRALLINDVVQQRNYSYFLSLDNGPLETFAETWAQLAMADNDYWDPYKDYCYFKSAFPASWDWMTANVPSALNGFSLPAATLNQRDAAGLTPLQNIGPRLNRTEFRQLLWQGADALLPDQFGKPPLDFYIQFNKPDHVKEILRYVALRSAVPNLDVMQSRIDRCRRYVATSFEADAPMYLAMLDRIEKTKAN